MPVDEKGRSRRWQAVERVLFQWTAVQKTAMMLLCGVTKYGRVRRKRPENEPWSLEAEIWNVRIMTSSAG